MFADAGSVQRNDLGDPLAAGGPTTLGVPSEAAVGDPTTLASEGFYTIDATAQLVEEELEDSTTINLCLVCITKTPRCRRHGLERRQNDDSYFTRRVGDSYVSERSVGKTRPHDQCSDRSDCDDVPSLVAPAKSNAFNGEYNFPSDCYYIKIGDVAKLHDEVQCDNDDVDESANMHGAGV